MNSKALAIGLFLSLLIAMPLAAENASGNASTIAGDSFSHRAGGITNKGDDWQFLAQAYSWLPDVLVKSRTGDKITIGAGDVAESLNPSVMTVFGARKKRWSLYLDTIYTDLSERSHMGAGLLGSAETVSTKLEIEAFLLMPKVGYAVYHSDNTRLELLAGFQYYYEDISFDYDIELLDRDNKVSVKDKFWDGVVGFMGTTELSDDWYLNYYGDIGTGDMDYITTLVANVNYRIGYNWVISAGYRFMYWKFDSDTRYGEAVDTQQAQGGQIGFKYFF